MAILVAGVALWWAGHLFRRMAPQRRQAMADRMGGAAKGLVALVLLGSVILMVVGYRRAAFVPVYWPPDWAVHLNNLLMLVAVILFGAGSSKGRMRSWFRHPMLLGFATWAVAHLLVNGDLASIVLFGGLLAWVPVSMAAIAASGQVWNRPEPGPVRGDVRLILISLAVYAAIAAIHAWLGVWPFPG